MRQVIRLVLICCACMLAFPIAAVAADKAPDQSPEALAAQAARPLQRQTREQLIAQVNREEKLIGSLDVTAEDRAEVKKAFAPVLQTAEAQLDSIKAGGAMTRAQNAELIRKLAQANRKIAAVMGPQRSEALKRKLNSPRHGFLKFVNVLRGNIAALDTTREQQQKAEPLLRDLINAAQELPDEMPEKSSGPAPGAQAVRDAMLKTSTGLKSILTPAQYHEILREAPMLKPEALDAANSASSKPSRDDKQ